jgi:hypothetical protein
MTTVPKMLKNGIESKNRVGNDTILLENVPSPNRIFVLVLQVRAHSTSTRMLRVIVKGKVEMGFVMPIRGYNALIDIPTNI